MTPTDPRPVRPVRDARKGPEEELVETREQLRRSQERLTTALAASHIGTFRVDFAANTADWDPNVAPLFGVDGAPGVHVFGELLHTLHGDDRPVVEAKFRECRTQGTPVDMEFRVIWPDRSVHWLAMRGDVTRDAAGRPSALNGALRDVSRIKNAEEALREETRMLEVLNETGKLLAGQLDLERLVQAVTDAATAVSGGRYGAFLYNVTDDHGEAYLLYSLSGVPRDALERRGQPPAAALFGATMPGEAPIRASPRPRHASVCRRIRHRSAATSRYRCDRDPAMSLAGSASGIQCLGSSRRDRSGSCSASRPRPASPSTMRASTTRRSAPRASARRSSTASAPPAPRSSA